MPVRLHGATSLLRYIAVHNLGQAFTPSLPLGRYMSTVSGIWSNR